MEKITKTKMTQTEFDALKRNGIGQLVVPDGTDCTEIDFRGAHMVAFGRLCELGDGANLGDRCQLGSYCKLGNECVLGITCSPECALERRRQWQRTADARRGGSGDTNIVTTKTNPDKYDFGDGSPRQDSPPRKNEKTHTASCTMLENDVLEFHAVTAQNGTTASALIRKWITSYLAGEQVEPEKDRLK